MNAQLRARVVATALCRRTAWHPSEAPRHSEAATATDLSARYWIGSLTSPPAPQPDKTA
jgi:hypothetical protein